jgi:hypothetical protein
MDLEGPFDGGPFSHVNATEFPSKFHPVGRQRMVMDAGAYLANNPATL